MRLGQEIALVLPRFRDPPLRQHLKGGAHRRPGHAEQVGQMLLAQMRAGVEAELADQADELVGQLLAAVQASPAFRRRRLVGCRTRAFRGLIHLRFHRCRNAPCAHPNACARTRNRACHDRPQLLSGRPGQLFLQILP
jgi:hypothetical protein